MTRLEAVSRLGRPRLIAAATIALGMVVVIAVALSRAAGPTAERSNGPTAPAPSAATAFATPAAASASLAAASPRPSGVPAQASAVGTAPAGSSLAAASAPPSSVQPVAVQPAPNSAVGFKARTTVVPMGFPLPASARYVYGSGWRTARDGVVYPYNQIRGVAPTGTLLRAHDGVDLQVPIGTLVEAPFSGLVVDPRTIWKPWDPERYGLVVAIRSSEATSRGYYTILVHLSRQNVRVGQVVKRGQVVGRTGITGNAEGTIPHLHFELRAPFPIAFHYGGVLRSLDSFDPLLSLRAADSHLR